MSTNPDTSRDEEIARALQLETEGTTPGKPPKSKPSKPLTATTTTTTAGTIVQFPDEQQSQTKPNTTTQQQQQQPIPTLAYTGVEIAPPNEERAIGAERRVVATSPETSAIMYAKMQFLIMSIAVACLIYWIFSVAFRAWWFAFSFGAIFCPLGWIGAKFGNTKLLFAFTGYLVVDLVFQVLFPFLYTYEIHAVGVVICLMLVVFQFLAVFYVWRFRQMLLLRNGINVGTGSIGFEPFI